MPVYPPEWVPPGLYGHYPNMARRDAVIWERVLKARGLMFKRVAYNLAFGGVVPNDPTATEDEVLGFQYSTAAKVDVVADVGDEWWLCEVKPNASYSAIGQVLSYYLLQEREGFTSAIVVPTIVTDSMLPDVAYVAHALNLQVLLAPDPTLQPGVAPFVPSGTAPGVY